MRCLEGRRTATVRVVDWPRLVRAIRAMEEDLCAVCFRAKLQHRVWESGKLTSLQDLNTLQHPSLVECTHFFNLQYFLLWLLSTQPRLRWDGG